MTFVREGKRLNYEEVIKTVDELVKQNILSKLEIQELVKLSDRILDFTEETLQSILKEEGYKAIKTRGVFSKAEQLNLLGHSSAWDRAIEMRENKKEGSEADKEEIIQFISDDYLKAMKSLDRKLKPKRKIDRKINRV